jgi:uncharacterized protein (TIGR02145 family)
MRKIIKTTVALLTMLNIAAFAQQKGTFKDARDGKTYKTVKIGEQTWMAENLNYLDKADKESKCYDNKPANCTKYGRLYNWETAKKACSKGWHLPSNEEWNILISYVESNKGCTNCAGKYLKAKSGWKSGNGEDAYGFSSLPGGMFESGEYNNAYFDVGDLGDWWSSFMNSNYNAYHLDMSSSSDDFSGRYSGISYLLSVRCLQD